MEDLKLILLVLAAVAYFVFTQWRKAFNSPKEDADPKAPIPGRRPHYPSKPATSFEDILRELQPKLEQAEAKGKAVAERTKELAKPLGAPLPPVAEARSLEKNYEDPAPGIKVLSWEKPSEARLAARLLEGQRNKNQSISYDKRKTTENKYATLLKSPASARDAVILTEILNRKYN